MRLGLDVGGTHLDGVILDQGKIVGQSKIPVGQGPLTAVVDQALDQVFQEVDPKDLTLVHLSTTVATNAIVEGKTRPVGLIVQRGPGLWEDFSDLTPYIYDVDGFVDHRGIRKADADDRQIDLALKAFRDKGIDALAVVSKFSPRNGEEEDRIRDRARGAFGHISLGHEMSGRLNFPRRVRTTVFNGGVAEVFEGFADSVTKGLAQRGVTAPVHILKADGGTMPIDLARARPVETILSGPAASFMGMMALLENSEDAVLIDIGGTTSDIFFIVDQLPLFEPMGAEIHGQKTLVRALFSESLGLGGDSALTLAEEGLMIGPDRQGPPVCLGGPCPTPTDAMVTLGKTSLGDPSLAESAMADLGQGLGLGPKEAAEYVLKTFADLLKGEVEAILRRINGKPLYTVREVLENRLFVPQEIRLIGGPSQVFAPYLEEAFGLPVRLPQAYHLANAIGAALAIPSFEANLIADTARGKLSVPELGIYEAIGPDYSLERAKETLMTAFAARGQEAEIIEEEAFRMVSGWKSHQNIRVKAQIAPGLAMTLGGSHES